MEKLIAKSLVLAKKLHLKTSRKISIQCIFLLN